MAENSKIQWTDHTFNPWIGCTKVSEACKFCYAEVFAGRYMKIGWGDHYNRHKTTSTWGKPLAWNRKAEKEGKRYRVFCASLADVFEDHPSIKQEWRDELFQLIRDTPHLDWLLLTKRPENYVRFLPADWGDGYQNVWLGTTAETQRRYNERAVILSSTPAKIRFMSFEPLLDVISLNPDYKLDWVIIGGESGFKKDARKLHLSQVKLVFEKAKVQGTKIFFKQLGTILSKEHKLLDGHGGNFDEYPPALDWLKVREIPGYEQVIELHMYVVYHNPVKQITIDMGFNSI